MHNFSEKRPLTKQGTILDCSIQLKNQELNLIFCQTLRNVQLAGIITAMGKYLQKNAMVMEEEI